MSAPLRLGGFYPWITVRLAELPLSPLALLGAVVAVAATLSAVFSNDIVCLSVAPVLARACFRRGLTPVPYLLALACASNVGSAATLIGNPQNMLIGSALGLSFLLTSRKLHSRRMLGLVDWELLVLFVGLFVINRAFEGTGLPAALVSDLAASGIHLDRPLPLFAATFVLSNVVSNVPAVMLLLHVAKDASAGPLLALVSTLAGNLFIVGSIANIIVVDVAARHGVRIDWRSHARVGVPVPLATLGIVAAYLAVRM